ncbi:futalosine hydrolase [Mucilaginibacter gossypiicola]|uniref:Futalosine hydrolase n=1 Tax=Mucilaginibacter gossypiicola TaxID=551995 RepID=A0A1H8QKZ3_9SPHI|nr:futalosine hydrolase [Mucilaginibacter gossypiicola]SEO54899.1 futalosine hydrolase [Mucilaginibacter gossypiicola]
MLILIVAATKFEVEPLANAFGSKVDIVVTGAGMVPTAFGMTRQLSNHTYDLAINLGIAGSFDRNFHLGDVLEVTEDTFAELGAQDDEDFIPINTLGFGESVFTPTTSLDQVYPNFFLKKAKAITVNTVHGHEPSIQKIQQRLNPQLESMEGAAFFYACRQMNIPGMQIRAVSNYVEKRNREAWNIGLAIKNLNTFAVDLVSQIINN